MHVLHWILTGIVAGLLARLVIPSPRTGWLGDLALGSLGGVASGWLFGRIGVSGPEVGPAHFVAATAGAIGMIAGMQLLLRMTERAAALAGAALGSEGLDAGLAKLSDLERRVLGRFLRREVVARDPNRILSCLAAVQAPVILMSQNRQAQKDRLHAQLDYEVNLKAEMEILALHEKLDLLREKAWSELVALQERQLALLDRIEREVAERHGAGA
ncbi:MAG: DUF1003 domain-containing protein [Myxococcota bacterium]